MIIFLFLASSSKVLVSCLFSFKQMIPASSFRQECSGSKVCLPILMQFDTLRLIRPPLSFSRALMWQSSSSGTNGFLIYSSTPASYPSFSLDGAVKLVVNIMMVSPSSSRIYFTISMPFIIGISISEMITSGLNDSHALIPSLPLLAVTIS